MSTPSPFPGRSAPARPGPAPVVPPAWYWPPWTDQQYDEIDLSQFNAAGHWKVLVRKCGRYARETGGRS